MLQTCCWLMETQSRGTDLHSDVLCWKRDTLVLLRKRAKYTLILTNTHRDQLLGGTWQGVSQWTKSTRWHKTSLRWAFYKLEHGRLMEQFSKTRPLGVSQMSLSSPLSSLCSHWSSKVWCDRMVKYGQKVMWFRVLH